MSKLIERFITPSNIGTFDTAGHLKRLIAARGPDVFTFEDDFVQSRLTGSDALLGATVTLVEAGAGETTVALADVAGGALRISADANENDGANIQWSPEAFKFSGLSYLYFGCRLKVSEATQSDFFVGLAVTDTDLLGGVTDSIGFRKVDGETAVNMLVEKNSTETTLETVPSVGTGYRYYEFIYDATGASPSIEVFVDGVSYGTIALTNLPDDEELRPSVHVLAGAAAASLVCDIDFLRIIQVGGRAT